MKLEDKVAYFGMVLVQGALLPSHFSGSFPHWTLPFFWSLVYVVINIERMFKKMWFTR